jgi:hypothetical protein
MLLAQPLSPLRLLLVDPRTAGRRARRSNPMWVCRLQCGPQIPPGLLGLGPWGCHWWPPLVACRRPDWPPSRDPVDCQDRIQGLASWGHCLLVPFNDTTQRGHNRFAHQPGDHGHPTGRGAGPSAYRDLVRGTAEFGTKSSWNSTPLWSWTVRPLPGLRFPLRSSKRWTPADGRQYLSRSTGIRSRRQSVR